MPLHLLQQSKPIKIAHRGYSLLYPQNTILSMQQAIKFNADILETDFCLTKDEDLVLSHDLTINACTNGSGFVRQYSVDELQEFDAGYTFSSDGQIFPFRDQGLQIPTARQLFEEFGSSVNYNIDLKDPDPVAVDVFLELVDEYNLSHNIILGSFHDEQVYRVRERNPDISTGTSYSETRKIVFASKLHLDRFLPTKPKFEVIQVPMQRNGIKILTPRFLNIMHRINVKVHIWTINDPVIMRNLLAIGVDGIFSDDIKVLDHVINSVYEEISGENFHIVSNP